MFDDPVSALDHLHREALASRFAAEVYGLDILAQNIEDAAHKLVKLLVADPSKVVYTGNGEVSLGCGARKPRRITVEYFPKANARLATAGEVATIDFQ